jgi:hypothetical protein
MDNGETLPARRGRPSKAEQVLTPEILERAAALLLEGHHKETVADFLGIHRATWWRWEQIGEREPETIYGDFCNVTRAAIAGAEIDAIRTIRAGRPDWPARAWLGSPSGGASGSRSRSGARPSVSPPSLASPLMN